MVNVLLPEGADPVVSAARDGDTMSRFAGVVEQRSQGNYAWIR